MAAPKRGEIYFAGLDPVVGSEQGGHRPVLIIQNDVSNEHSPVVIVAAISSRMLSREYPTDVIVEPNGSGLSVRSRIVLNQTRTVDKQRLGRYVGKLDHDVMDTVDEAIRISLGLASVLEERMPE